jgi:GH25 family lysozyme M1 (1,4-beta-N-acetylmuramidase)
MRFRRLFAAPVVALICLTVFAVPAASAYTWGCETWVHGIDVSDAQGNIDWQSVPTSGVAFAYIKATEGTTFVAYTAARNRAGAAAAGVPFGSYDFARPSGGTSAQAEAWWFVAHGGAEGTLPPALDLEVTGGQSPQELGQWARTWLDSVHYLTGRTPIIYMGGYFAIDTGYVQQFRLWLPGYPAGYAPDPVPCNLPLPRNPVGMNWTIWQYSSSTHVAGISGDVDGSIAAPGWFRDETGVIAVPAPTPQPTVDASWQTYTVGSRGPGVVKIQQLVGATADGVYGPATAAAVARWQQMLRLPADGVWGRWTQIVTGQFLDYLAAVAAAPPVVQVTPAVVPTPTLPRAHAAWAVIALQWDLGIRADGIYGPQTAATVANLQRFWGLPVTGIYDQVTANALSLSIR